MKFKQKFSVLKTREKLRNKRDGEKVINLLPIFVVILLVSPLDPYAEEITGLTNKPVQIVN
jgi:hypothetical protein